MKNLITKFDLRHCLCGLLLTLVLIVVCDRYDLFESLGGKKTPTATEQLS